MFYSPSSHVPFGFLENTWILECDGINPFDLSAEVSFMLVSCLRQTVAWCHD